MRAPFRALCAFVVTLTACRPHADPEGEGCADDEMAAGDACVPAACGTEPWPATAGQTFRVATDGTPDGDGSEERPYLGIQDAADAAARAGGGTVLLAAGTYAEHVMLGSEHDGVDLVGRCPELVTVEGVADEAPVVTIEKTGAVRPTVTLRDLTLQNGGLGGVKATRSLVTLEDIVIRDVGWIGVYASGGNLTLRRVDVGLVRVAQSTGRGVHLDSGVEALLEDVTIHDVEDFGVYAGDRGTNATLHHVRIRGTRAGVGLQVDLSAQAAIAGLDVDANALTGLQIVRDASVTVQDAQIRNTLPDDRGRLGDGIAIALGGQATFRNVHVTGNARNAILVRDPDSSLEMEGGTISENGIAALVVLSGGFARVKGTPITDNAGAGITVRDSGSRVALEALEVSGTYPTVQATDGIGVAVYSGAHLAATDVDIVGNHNFGLDAWADVNEESAVVSLTDVRISGTRRNVEVTERGDLGPGLVLRENAELTAVGLVIEDNERMAMAVASGSRADVSDCVLSSSVPDSDGRYGRGVQVQETGLLSLQRCSIDNHFEVGVFAASPGTVLTLTDTTITGTKASANASLAPRGGLGLAVQAGAVATMTGGTISGTVGGAVLCAQGGARLHMRVVDISDSRPTEVGYFGRGLTTGANATVLAEDVTISGSTEMGAMADGADAHLELVRVDVDGTRMGRDSNLGYGVFVTGGGVVSVQQGRITGTEGPGLVAYLSGTARATETEISGNRFAGAAALLGGTVEIDRSSIRDNATDLNRSGGIGVYARSGDVASTLRIIDSEIGPHPYAAVWLDGAGSYHLDGSDLESGREPGDRSLMQGNVVVAIGVDARDGASGLDVTGSTLHGSPAAAVLLEASSMRQSDNAWRDNATDVLQQRCDGLTPLDPEAMRGVPDALICPPTNVPIDASVELSFIYVQDLALAE